MRFSSRSGHGRSPGCISPALNSAASTRALLFLESVAKGETGCTGSQSRDHRGRERGDRLRPHALFARALESGLLPARKKRHAGDRRRDSSAGRRGREVRVSLGAAPPHGRCKGNVRAIEIVKTRLGEYDTSGRRKPVLTDEIQRFECDSVIFAVGETVDLDFVRASGLRLKESGTIDVDRFSLVTSRAPFLCRGRRGYRRFQRLQCDGLWQTGRTAPSTSSSWRRIAGSGCFPTLL